MGITYPAAIIITDTNAHTGRFGKITCLTDSTVTLVSSNVTKNGSSTVSGIDLKQVQTLKEFLLALPKRVQGHLLLTGSNGCKT